MTHVRPAHESRAPIGTHGGRPVPSRGVVQLRRHGTCTRGVLRSKDSTCNVRHVIVVPLMTIPMSIEHASRSSSWLDPG